MRSEQTPEIIVVCFLLAIGGYLFVRAIGLSASIPDEFRSASPGFGWAWDFDYAAGMAEAGRFGEAPWPWPAQVSGEHLLLPLDQPLTSNKLKLTYQGMSADDRFRLAVVIQGLDPGVTYPQEFSVPEALRGLTIDDRRFVLESITPRYLRLRLTNR